MNLASNTIKRLKSKYADWALITGASSGIGRELALLLAEAGFKLIITGRRVQALEALSTEMFDKYQTECIPVPGDLSQREDLDHLLEQIAHLEVGIAILNAGYGTSGPFLKADLNEELNMLDLNCRAVLIMAQHFGLKMQAQNQKGAIVFLSSMVAFQGVPNAAHYAASKAYVQSLGEALAQELKSSSVDVLVSAPGPVASGFAERANMRMNMSLEAKQVAVPIINAVGKKNFVIPGFLSKFLVYNLRMVPRWAKVRIMGLVMGGFTSHQS